MSTSPWRRLVSRRTAVVLLVAAAVVVPLAALVRVQWAPLENADLRVDDDAHRLVLAHSSVLHVVRWVTHLGDPLVVTALCAVLAIALAVRRHWRAAAYVVVVRAVAVAIGFALKEGIGRARPHLSHPVAHAHGLSFPSGHALGAAALWATFAVLLTPRLPRGWAITLAVVVPLAVAATRVLLGVHFVSDVVAGLVIGWTTAVVTADVLRLRGDDVDADEQRSSA